MKARTMLGFASVVGIAGIALLVDGILNPSGVSWQLWGFGALTAIAIFGSVMVIGIYLEPGGAIERGVFFADRIPVSSLWRFDDPAAFSVEDARWGTRKRYTSFEVLRVTSIDGKVASFNSSHRTPFEEAIRLLRERGLSIEPP